MRLLFSLLPTHPIEFYDRVRTLLEVRLDRWRVPAETSATLEWQQVIGGIERALHQELDSFLNEPAVAELETHVRRQVDDIRARAPFTLIHNADFSLARLCYGSCRAFKPAVVVETGVAYGVTSAFILRALEVNGGGLLHSVDLPPLGRDADQFVGILIPEAFKQRWRLYRGASARVLTSLLPQLGRIDLFIHDSLHTYANMRREFQLVAPYLGHPSIVIADDIEGNQAFQEWVRTARPAFWATLRETEKHGICGVSVFS